MPPYTASPSLINSIIQSESAGNPYAVSPTGARGLMQVQPATARSPGFGVDPFSGGNLFDPEANKQFGTNYFDAMLNRYGGDQEAALVAYNAGPGNADKWVSSGKDWSVLPKPEETRPYVTSTLGRLDGENDMANGNRRRPSVYQPQREAGTGRQSQNRRQQPWVTPDQSQGGWQTSTVPLPTAPAPGQDGQGLDLPGKPSKTDLSMAEALMQGAQRDAQNTRGTGLGLAGALAQQLSGSYLAGQYEDEQQQYNQALGEAMAGAEGREGLQNTLLQSGDEDLRNAAVTSMLKRPEPSNRYSATDTGMVFDKQTGEVVQSGTDPSLAASREAEGKQVGKSRGERRQKIFEDAQKAISNNRRLNYFESLNKEASTGGFLSEVSLGGKRFLGFLGIEPGSLGLPDNASASEALQALTTRSALDVSQQTKGAISDREMDMFQQAVPSLLNTKQGNQKIIDFLRTANQRRIALNKRAVDYVREQGTLDEGFASQMQEIYEANPIPDLSEYAQPEEGQQEGGAPEPGTVVDGYRFKGGDPGNPNNWEQVQPTGQQAGPGGFAR